jgi:hypothetical protein
MPVFVQFVLLAARQAHLLHEKNAIRNGSYLHETHAESHVNMLCYHLACSGRPKSDVRPVSLVHDHRDILRVTE